MTRSFAGTLISVTLISSVPSESAAQILAQRSFNELFQGDDPGAVFPFDLVANPSVPIEVHFDGLFQNLAPAETGVRYDLSWLRPDGTPETIGIDFTRLPASGQLPLQIDQPVAFTPDMVFFHVEGGGPSDHFRFIGDFSIEQVPEPATLSLVAVVTLASLSFRRHWVRRWRIPEG